MDFSHHKSPNHTKSFATRVGFGDKWWEIHLAYFTLQSMLTMLNTLHKVEDHENHVSWIYLTTVLYMEESQKHVRT